MTTGPMKAVARRTWRSRPIHLLARREFFVLLLIGLVVLIVGVYFVVKGLGRGFVDDIDLPEGKAGVAIVGLGILGYGAEGLALGFTGMLLGIAAVKSAPNEAAGLDGSLRALSELPLGQVILVLIGLGFIACGLYCVVRARLARLE